MNLVLILLLATPLTPELLSQNHKSVLDTFNIPAYGMNGFDLPYLYWIHKLHRNPYKHRYIAGSSKCSTKPLSLLLTTAVKEKLQTYCATTYTRSGVNQMWILNGYELCPFASGPVSVFLRGGIYSKASTFY